MINYLYDADFSLSSVGSIYLIFKEKVHQTVRSSKILSQINPIHTLQPYFSNIYPSTRIPLDPSSDLKLYTYLSSPLCMLHAPLTSPSLTYLNICQRVQIIELLITQLSTTSLFLSRSNILHHESISEPSELRRSHPETDWEYRHRGGGWFK